MYGTLGATLGHSWSLGATLGWLFPLSPSDPFSSQINSGCIYYATGSRDDRLRNANPLKCGDGLVLVLGPGTIVILVRHFFGPMVTGNWVCWGGGG